MWVAAEVAADLFAPGVKEAAMSGHNRTALPARHPCCYVSCADATSHRIGSLAWRQQAWRQQEKRRRRTTSPACLWYALATACMLHQAPRRSRRPPRSPHSCSRSAPPLNIDQRVWTSVFWRSKLTTWNAHAPFFPPQHAATSIGALQFQNRRWGGVGMQGTTTASPRGKLRS
jgi:hypothetical protein